MVKKGETTKGKHAAGKLRPHVWKCGPDPVIHDMYNPWLKAKAQSDYRNRQGLEIGTWKLSFEDFAFLWKDLWHARGRGNTDVCLSRKDFKKAWTLENCEVITRLEHLKRQNAQRRGTKYNKRKPIEYVKKVQK